MKTKTGTYEIGELVQHRLYGYRGVVVGMDYACEADEDWYQRNRTQPDRNQPWYRVLVDGGRQTYVAQDNLEPDDTGELVDHPAVPVIFTTFLAGRYYRFCPN